MLRITGLSLLLGLIMLVAGLSLLAPASTTTGNTAPRVTLDPAAARVENEGGTVGDRMTLYLRPGAQARLHYTLPAPVAASHYPFLRLALAEPDTPRTVILHWDTLQDGETASHSYRVENSRRDDLWLATGELRGFDGELTALGLEIIDGAGGGDYVLSDLSLHTAALTHWFRALHTDWLVYHPWNRSAMNTHTGVTKVSSFYPLMLAAGLLGCALLAYAGLLLVARSRLRVDWRIPGLVFLACWLLLDFSWQTRLWLQVRETGLQFSGLNSEEKLKVGPDAELIDFVNKALERIPPGSRVFVTSQDNYIGMRTAYYLYPNNVYYNMQVQLPQARWMRKDDFIVVVDDPQTQFLPDKRVLKYPHSLPLPARELVKHSAGTLYRVP